MTLSLLQSAVTTVLVGPFIHCSDGGWNSTDGASPITDLTIAQASIRLSKNGLTPAQSHVTSGAIHQENGYYSVPLDGVDTGTVGRLQLMITISGSIAVKDDYEVLPAVPFNSLIAGSDYLDVSIVQWNGHPVPTDPVSGCPVVTLSATQAAYVPITSGGMVNVTKWGSQPVATPAVSGQPVVTLGSVQAAYTPLTAAVPMTLVSGQVVIAGVVSDKTGYILQSGQIVVVGGSLDKSGYSLATGQIVITGANNDKTGYSLVSGQTVLVSNKTGYSLATGQIVITGANNDKTGYSLLSGQIIPSANVNVTEWAGQAVATPTLSGIPRVTLNASQPDYEPLTSGAEVRLASGTLVIPDKTGYSLASGQQVITVLNLDKENYSVSGKVALLSGQNVIVAQNLDKTDYELVSGQIVVGAVNVTEWAGQPVAAPTLSGIPRVTLNASQPDYMPMVSGSLVALTSSGRMAMVNAILDELTKEHLDPETIGAALATLTGEKLVISNQLVFHAADNATELARFNLFDSDGVPTMINVYRRSRST
jgi:formylmethanofuran dehydrogenase subunit C